VSKKVTRAYLGFGISVGKQEKNTKSKVGGWNYDEK
jgi:hypothetical protein